MVYLVLDGDVCVGVAGKLPEAALAGVGHRVRPAHLQEGALRAQRVASGTF